MKGDNILQNVKKMCGRMWSVVATLTLGSQVTTKAKGLARLCVKKRSPGITPHAPGSVGKCEGMNLHTPK
jgi:hypothetical protein